MRTLFFLCGISFKRTSCSHEAGIASGGGKEYQAQIDEGMPVSCVDLLVEVYRVDSMKSAVTMPAS